MLNKYESGASEPPFTAMAALCMAAKVRMEWLATGKGSMHSHSGVSEEPPKWANEADSQLLRSEPLNIALQLTAEALEGRVLPPHKHAELIALVYDLLVEGMPEAKVLRFARAAAA